MYFRILTLFNIKQKCTRFFFSRASLISFSPFALRISSTLTILAMSTFFIERFEGKEKQMRTVVYTFTRIAISLPIRLAISICLKFFIEHVYEMKYYYELMFHDSSENTILIRLLQKILVIWNGVKTFGIKLNFSSLVLSFRSYTQKNLKHRNK